MVTDRGLYRPGETVTVKGWVRKIKKSGNLAIIHGQILAVIKNSHYQPILTKHVEADIHGAFDFEFDLPHDCQHGMAKIELVAIFCKTYPRLSNSSHNIHCLQQLQKNYIPFSALSRGVIYLSSMSMNLMFRNSGETTVS